MQDQFDFILFNIVHFTFFIEKCVRFVLCRSVTTYLKWVGCGYRWAVGWVVTRK